MVRAVAVVVVVRAVAVVVAVQALVAAVVVQAVAAVADALRQQLPFAVAFGFQTLLRNKCQ